jgi:hypothetical protein
MGVHGMLVATLTVFVSQRRAFLGLLVLPVGVMVCSLHVMMCGRVVVRGRKQVVLDRRVFVLFSPGVSS